jgi:transcriptional antiterminator RfaH
MQQTKFAKEMIAPPEDTTKPSSSAWYCLRSQPMREHIAAAHLRVLQGVTVFCPRIRFKRARRQNLTWVTEAMFPCYLFARFDFAELHRQVRYAQGVSGIVRFGTRYPTIEEEVLASLRTETGSSGIKELNYRLAQGDQVKIVKGAFTGLIAVVTQVLPGKQRVRILMEFLGRKLETEVEDSSVLPQAAQPFGGRAQVADSEGAGQAVAAF